MDDRVSQRDEDFERSNPMLMRVIAGILAVLILLGIVIAVTSDSGWLGYSNAMVGAVLEYFCIAYTSEALIRSASYIGKLFDERNPRSSEA